MTKILVDVDDEVLAKAAKRLGTTTKKDTINTALAEVDERYDRLQAYEELRAIAAEGHFDELFDKKTYRR
jgi:Arc/MetJ family transcription regulator